MDWKTWAALIVAVEYLVALAIGAWSGFAYPIPVLSFVIVSAVLVGAAILVSVVAALGRLAARKERHPARHLGRETNWHRTFEISAGVTLVALQMCVLGWLKVMMPVAVGFRADRALATFDAKFWGGDAWVLAHLLFDWAGPLIDRCYVTWAPVKFTALMLLLVLPPSTCRARCLLAYFIIAAVSALGQYLAPSGGPVFYALIGLGDRFDSLPIQPWVETARSYLWSDYLRGGGKVGTGISAMPSLHVAVALWLVFVARSYCPRWQAIAWLYFAGIFIGSIYLGWHYGIDAIAGCAVAALAWASAMRWLRCGEKAVQMTVLRPV